MWTVVYISQSEDIAKEIKDLLEASQILVMMRSAGEKEQKSFEILVPETEVEQAHNIIINNN